MGETLEYELYASKFQVMHVTPHMTKKANQTLGFLTHNVLVHNRGLEKLQRTNLLSVHN